MHSEVCSATGCRKLYGPLDKFYGDLWPTYRMILFVHWGTSAIQIDGETYYGPTLPMHYHQGNMPDNGYSKSWHDWAITVHLQCHDVMYDGRSNLLSDEIYMSPSNLKGMVLPGLERELRMMKDMTLNRLMDLQHQNSVPKYWIEFDRYVSRYNTCPIQFPHELWRISHLMLDPIPTAYCFEAHRGQSLGLQLRRLFVFLEEHPSRFNEYNEECALLFLMWYEESPDHFEFFGMFDQHYGPVQAPFYKWSKRPPSKLA